MAILQKRTQHTTTIVNACIALCSIAYENQVAIGVITEGGVEQLLRDIAAMGTALHPTEGFELASRVLEALGFDA